MADINVKVTFDKINVKEKIQEHKVKILMLKGEKGDTGNAVWGSITGDISTQTDLQNVLNGKASAESVATNTSDISSLQSSVATNTSDISSLQTDVSANTSDISSLQSSVSSNTSDISSLQSDVSSNTSDISDLQNRLEFEIVNSMNDTIKDTTSLVFVKGRNLIKVDMYKGAYLDHSTGRIVTNVNNALFDEILVEPNTQYTYSSNVQCNSLDVAYFTKDHTFISTNNKSNTNSNTFTTPANCYICIPWVNYNNQSITQSVINSLQLQFEQNSTRTAYQSNTDKKVLAKNSNNKFENIYQEGISIDRLFQVVDVNSSTFEIIIPHQGGSNIKNALVITTEWCGIVSIGSRNQTWVITLGNRNSTQCTAEQIENTSTFVRVKLTFTNTQYGGIQVICPYQKP